MEKGGKYSFLEYCIAGHHAGLPDYGSNYDNAGDPTLMGRRKKKISDYQAYQKEIDIPEIVTDPFDFKKTVNPDFSMSVFIRMLYSCLVDADFLDTEAFMSRGQKVRNSGEPMEALDSSDWWRKDNSFFGLCITSCGGKSNGSGNLRHSIYKYY